MIRCQRWGSWFAFGKNVWVFGASGMPDRKQSGAYSDLCGADSLADSLAGSLTGSHKYSSHMFSSLCVLDHDTHPWLHDTSSSSATHSLSRPTTDSATRVGSGGSGSADAYSTLIDEWQWKSKWEFCTHDQAVNLWHVWPPCWLYDESVLESRWDMFWHGLTAWWKPQL